MEYEQSFKMVESLLDEYFRVSYELRKTKESLYELKNSYLEMIDLETDKDRKKELFNEYALKLESYSNYENIKNYKSLKKRKKKLVKYFCENMKSNCEKNYDKDYEKDCEKDCETVILTSNMINKRKTK